MTLKIRLLSLSLLLFAAAPAMAQQPPKKLIILGFDGVDAKLTQRWMDEGKLPNLAKLRSQGTFTPLRPTIPSQTPVSWSTFSTGLNPGRHGVFDFLKRNPKDYKPTFAAAEVGREPFLWGDNNPWILGVIAALVVALLFLLILKLFRLRWAIAAAVALVLGIGAGIGAGFAADNLLPKSRPIAINNQHGDTFWKLLGDAGQRVTVMRIPVTFPPKAFEHGRLLSGLGVPDLSARIGKPFYFTSELFFSPKGGGDFSVEVTELVDNRGTIETEIKGPPNELFPKQKGRDYIKIPMTLTVAENRSNVRIQVSGNDLTLKPGQWSNWVRFTFPFNSLIKLKGIGKFKLLSIDPEVRLYLSPIEFDPQNLPPGFDITTPPGFVDELTHEHGLFKTKGWMIDTWSLTNGTADEQTFLDDVKMTVDKEKEILDGRLAKDDWDVLVHYFEFPDRVQHMMFRFFDPKHPLYTAEGAAKWGGSILASYQEMDRIVGEVMRKRPDAALMVLSDHGFASFRRGMNYNTWLAKNGFMTLTGEEAKRKNLEDLFDQGNFFTNVDWSKTKAYALGLGQIYINLKGREAHGIVSPGEESKRVQDELITQLMTMTDPKTGARMVDAVYKADDVYSGEFIKNAAELQVGLADGYRVSWQSTLGGSPPGLVYPNMKKWSGDHGSFDYKTTPGTFISSRPADKAALEIIDIAPTVLKYFGVPIPSDIDGKSIF